MTCQASARPPVQQYLWYRSDEIIARGRVFQINEVSRENDGEYWCEAINSEGVGQSGKINIVVVYKPVCHAPEVTHHPQNFSPGVSLTCQVESYPSARSYRWQYNSSQGSFQIPNAKSMMSFMNYAVSEEGGEGEVLCWATNEVGEQTVPCVFHVVPLGAPHPPHDCQVMEMTDNTVSVLCEAGYSGGEDQHFVLSLLDMVEGVQTAVMSNWSSNPYMILTGLDPEHPRLLSVHSANSHGKSDPIYLTTDVAASIIGQLHDDLGADDRQSVLYIIVSVLSSIMILSLLLSLSHFCRRKRLERLSSKIEAERPNIQILSQSTPLLTDSSQSSDRGEHRNKQIAKELLPRKVSFCGQCDTSRRLTTSQNHGLGNGNGIKKTVIRSYSIDKLRPKCYTCNPTGDLPYPANTDSDEYYDNV